MLNGVNNALDGGLKKGLDIRPASEQLEVNRSTKH